VTTGRPNSFLFLLSIYILCCALFFVFSWPAAAQNSSPEENLPSIEQRYNQAKFYFNQLLTNKKLSSQRENWAKGAQNFRRIYLAEPKSNQAASCLFMLGRLYHHMYLTFHKEGDLDESISYYKDTARLFSDHRLADDSYYSLGRIYLSDKNDTQSAAENLSKVVSSYPNGDMHPLASDMMKQLSKDHDIALPDAMVGGSSQLSKLNYVLPVKYWSSNDYTRVVIMASGPVKYREELLQETKDIPRRLYIDFQESYIEPQYRAPVPIEDGLLKQIRTGQFSKDTVRVVLDIESIGSYKIYSLPDPFRVVIDVRGEPHTNTVAGTPQADPSNSPSLSSKSKSATNGPIILADQKKFATDVQKFGKEDTKAKMATSDTQELSLAQQLGLGVKRIVLDPGHGGKDPGAIANGLEEKDIVLKLAKQLKPILEKELGCEVLLTRTDDTYISLEERTAIANTQNADLFLSLHINAHSSSKVRGIETYYLNLSTNADAMRVAARENSTSTHQMSDLQDILSDILKNSKINESSRLAKQVHNSILTGLDNNAFGSIRNLGVKQAPFYVLIGAQMPAILLEIAFISNEEDARNLQSPDFIATLAHQITQGVRGYISNTNIASLTRNFE
jgi:N-acetylmuramoyl-L-alanine amidase